MLIFFLVYLETGRQINAGNININIGALPRGQIRNWKVNICSASDQSCLIASPSFLQMIRVALSKTTHSNDRGGDNHPAHSLKKTFPFSKLSPLKNIISNFLYNPFFQQ